MTTFVRVTDKSTGYEYDLPETAIDDAAHERLNDPENWPDLSGPTAAARPPVYPDQQTTERAAAPAKASRSSKKKPTKQAPAAVTAAPVTTAGAPADGES